MELYTRWLLDSSVQAQFGAFRRGFLRASGPCAVLVLMACMRRGWFGGLWQQQRACSPAGGSPLAPLPAAPPPVQVCNGPALTLFTPTDLELLVCGLPHLDFEALQRVARYEGWGRP